MFTQVNVGETDYDAVQFAIEKRFSSNWSSRVSYTVSHGRGNFDGSGTPTSGFQLLDDMRLDLNAGPLDSDRRHNLVISGSALVPRTSGLTVSWVARALSGSPFTLTDSTTDLDRNGSFQEPLPSGSYSGEGEDAITVDFDSKRNGARGPGFFQLDSRLGYRLQLGGDRTFDLFGEIFNVTNRANFTNPSGNPAGQMKLVVESRRRAFPDESAERTMHVTPLMRQLAGDYRSRLYLLFTAVSVVLLIACGNVSNLLLARATTRGRELAVRSALGAGQGRLVRQLLTESIVLGIVSAAAGVALAAWLINLLVALGPQGVPRPPTGADRRHRPDLRCRAGARHQCGVRTRAGVGGRGPTSMPRSRKRGAAQDRVERGT